MVRKGSSVRVRQRAFTGSPFVCGDLPVAGIGPERLGSRLKVVRVIDLNRGASTFGSETGLDARREVGRTATATGALVIVSSSAREPRS